MYRAELAALEHVKVVHILNSEPEYRGEKGFITLDLLQKYLKEQLTSYEFLICGPPVMIIKLEADLVAARVPADQIHHELLAW